MEYLLGTKTMQDVSWPEWNQTKITPALEEFGGLVEGPEKQSQKKKKKESPRNKKVFFIIPKELQTTF